MGEKIYQMFTKTTGRYISFYTLPFLSIYLNLPAHFFCLPPSKLDKEPNLNPYRKNKSRDLFLIILNHDKFL